MQVLQVSVDDPATNLAIDEALLNDAEASETPLEYLRLWEFSRPVVVVGRASKVADEVQQPFCREAGIPILRRCSGGTAVTVGPGCLLYSLVLSTELRPEMREIDTVHRFVMQSVQSQLSPHLDGLEFQGTCDLSWNDQKFSGNSLRVAKRSVLYHGTVLYDFPVDLVHSTLGTPPRQPDYRRDRAHKDFVSNVPIDKTVLSTAFCAAFAPGAPVSSQWPEESARQLVIDRYARDEWNLRH